MSIIGTWRLMVQTPIGPQASTLTLRDDGTGLTSSQLGSSDVSEVRVDGDSATFTVKIEVMGQEVVLKGIASASGDSISGRYESSTGVSTFAGQRAS
jgi:hypothetical protein